MKLNKEQQLEVLELAYELINEEKESYSCCAINAAAKILFKIEGYRLPCYISKNMKIICNENNIPISDSIVVWWKNRDFSENARNIRLQGMRAFIDNFDRFFEDEE